MLSIPSSSWDVHVHIFDPERHPYVPDSLYTPPASTVSDLMAKTPTENAVVVMAAPDGNNTDSIVDHMQQLRSAGRQARGVVFMSLDQMTPNELQRLDKAGVRSVRFNSKVDGDQLPSMWARGIEAIVTAGVKWSIEAVIFDIALWHSLIPLMKASWEKHGTIFVADHILGLQPSHLESEQFADLLKLIEDGVLVVKISGLYKYDREPREMMPIVKKILEKRQGRGGMWASDWPHVIPTRGSTSLYEVDLHEHLALLKEVCDALPKGTWERLMRDNAAEVYA
ncbi:amidohydrolase domain-containing protein [Sarocladium implicatum]|nr:amidohydrolase domain-containing protein [Sarocladium implicatum]